MGGGAMFTTQQKNYQFRADDGTQVTASSIGAVNTPISDQATDQNLRIRFELQETAGASGFISPQLQFAVDGGGFTSVDGASTVVRASTSPNVTDNTATTNIMTGGTGTFAASSVDTVDGLAADATLAASGHTECEFCVQIRSADVAGGESIEFRVIGHSGGGTPLSAYTNSPTLTVAAGIPPVTGTVAVTQDDQTPTASGFFEDIVTPLTSGANIVDASSYNTASVTVGGANRVAIVAVHTINGTTPNSPTLSGPTGMDWVVVRDFFYDQVSTFRKLTVFAGTAASPTSGAITISYAGQTQNTVEWSVVEAKDTDITTAKGVVQSAQNDSGTALTAVVTLGAIGSADNMVYGAFANDNNLTYTPGTGFTELHDVNASPDATDGTLFTEWLQGTDTTVDATASGSIVQNVGIALELAAVVTELSGTVAVTQDDQSSTATGQLGYTGTVGPPTDVYDAGSTATPPTDIVDAGDTATPPTDVINAGDTQVQDSQTATATGWITVTGTVAVTQESQTSTASGTVAAGGEISGTVAATQADQTSTVAGQLGYSGSLAVTQADQTPTATGQLGYTGTVATTQADQTTTATGQLGYTGTVAVTQADQTATATGTSAGIGEIAGAAAVTQDNQTATAVGQVGYTGAATATQDNQTSTAAGTVVNPVTGTVAATQDSQSGVAAGWIAIFGTVAVTQGDQIPTITGFVGEIPIPSGHRATVPTGTHVAVVPVGAHRVVIPKGSHVEVPSG